MKSRGVALPTPDRSTRDVILDAAERHFAERGFAGVSVREIAADAGLRNQASLYHHFRHKRALYEAVLTRGLDPIIAVVAASRQRTGRSGSTPDPIAFLDAVLDYLIEHPHLPRLIQRAALDDSRYLRSAVSRLLRPLYAQGLGVLANASAVWRAEDLPHVGAGLYQLIFGYFATAALFEIATQSDPLSPAALARQRRFLRTAVAQLLGPPAAARPRVVRPARRPGTASDRHRIA